MTSKVRAVDDDGTVHVDAEAARPARRSCGAGTPSSGPTTATGRALAPPRAAPAQGRRGVHRDRPARGLEDPRRRPRHRGRPVDDPQRARDAGGARACSPIRTPPPGASRPTPATAGTSTSCSTRPALVPARRAPRPAAHPPRGRRGDARHLRDALAGHQPAGDRLRAADRHGDGPPRRGPAAAAAGPDGRRHHLDRRRDQARLHLRPARRPRPRRLGRPVPRRAPDRRRPRRADAAHAPGRHRASAPSERAFLDGAERRSSPSWPRPPRTRSTSTAPRA